MSKLIVESSPHIRSGNSTQKIMLHVIIAMIPTLVASVYIFGINALILTVICVTSCVIFEHLFEVVLKKRRRTVSDLSAVVTGLLLGFNLPVTLPNYMAIIGSFIAIVIVKQMFGGIGQNFANPAIVARIVLSISFTTYMSDWVKPFYYRITETDALSTATPLSQGLGSSDIPSFIDLFLGFNAGTLGETCAVTIILGFIYLLVFRIISPVTPLAYIGTVVVVTLISGGGLDGVLFQILTGGLLLGAVFMATDYVTSPLTRRGKLIFGIGCGLITVVIRNYSSMDEGVSFSILLMNILTPYIDKLTIPKPFGYVKEVKKDA